MSGDRLALIAARMSSADQPFLIVLTVDERDGLVEIARAARDAYDAMERMDAGLETNSEAGTPDWFIAPATVLNEALARLDSGAAE